ncbi:MAG: T9SS type A sorting domain-containing protein, partial [Thermoanaerobaculia bacterium]|nr:T9SS type A sorting domain-containing protein [Thermoanaerobaculia bacterium]
GVKLSEALGLDEKGMEKVAYTTDLRPAEVHLAFLDPVVSGVHHADPETSGVQLLQSRPNPFSDRTAIGFVLPEACAAQLRVFDVSGRELLRIDKSYPAGYSEETIRLDGSTGAGVLYYELTTPFGTVSKKMVRVEK